jgi:hypothetical protein
MQGAVDMAAAVDAYVTNPAPFAGDAANALVAGINATIEDEVYPGVTLVSIARLVQDGGNAIVFNPTTNKFEQVADARTLAGRQQQVLPSTFDYNHVYQARPLVPPNTTRRYANTGGILGQVEQVVGSDNLHHVQHAVDSLVAELLGSEPRNARELELFTGSPALLTNVGKARNEDSATMRACLLSMLFMQITYQNMLQMIESNTYCWWGNVIPRAWQMHVMSTIALLKGGPTTGVTYWGHAKFEMNQVRVHCTNKR